MANIGKWIGGANPPGTPIIIFSGMTQATNTMTSASSTYDNSANLDLYVMFEVNLAALSPSAGAYVAIYGLSSIDGTNFGAQSDADLRLCPTALLATIPIGTTASTAQRVASGIVTLAPTKWQFKCDNQTGATFVATSTLKLISWNVNGNG